MGPETGAGRKEEERDQLKMLNSKFKIEGYWRGDPSGLAPGCTQPVRICRRKHMISRRLWPIFTFFTPFLSHKGVDFSPVRKKTGNKKFRGQTIGM